MGRSGKQQAATQGSGHPQQEVKVEQGRRTKGSVAAPRAIKKPRPITPRAMKAAAREGVKEPSARQGDRLDKFVDEDESEGGDSQDLMEESWVEDDDKVSMAEKDELLDDERSGEFFDDDIESSQRSEATEAKDEDEDEEEEDEGEGEGENSGGKQSDRSVKSEDGSESEGYDTEEMEKMRKEMTRVGIKLPAEELTMLCGVFLTGAGMMKDEKKRREKYRDFLAACEENKVLVRAINETRIKMELLLFAHKERLVEYKLGDKLSARRKH